MFTKMNSTAAEQICGWKYEPPYDVYNYVPYDEAIKRGAAITKPENAENYICFWDGDLLAAYASIISQNDKVFIGIGIAPCLCGKGMGVFYLKQAVIQAHEMFPENEIWVQVRSWNERAIQCYKKCGFIQMYNDVVNDRFGNDAEFIFMKYEFLELETVSDDNLNFYTLYENTFEEDLKQYQSRIYPDKNAVILRWYHIKVNNKHIGAVWLERNTEDDFAVLGIFIADSKLRGKGIGEKVIKKIIQNDLQAMNTNKVILRVRESNKRAIFCYEKVGFKETKRYQKGDIKVIEMEYIC